VCRWLATYHWKALHEGYNFALDLISIGGLHTKLWAPKVSGDLVVGISGLPLGSPRTKCNLNVGPMPRHKVYYKGEGVCFPQVRAMVSLVSPSLIMACFSTKNVRAMHLPTCCLVLCRSMWMNDCLLLFLVPSRSSSTPLYPQRVASQGACPNSLLFHYFHFKFTFESIKELENASPNLKTTLLHLYSSRIFPMVPKEYPPIFIFFKINFKIESFVVQIYS